MRYRALPVGREWLLILACPLFVVICLCILYVYIHYTYILFVVAGRITGVCIYKAPGRVGPCGDRLKPRGCVLYIRTMWTAESRNNRIGEDEHTLWPRKSWSVYIRTHFLRSFHRISVRVANVWGFTKVLFFTPKNFL